MRSLVGELGACDLFPQNRAVVAIEGQDQEVGLGQGGRAPATEETSPASATPTSAPVLGRGFALGFGRDRGRHEDALPHDDRGREPLAGERRLPPQVLLLAELRRGPTLRHAVAAGPAPGGPVPGAGPGGFPLEVSRGAE